MKPLLLLFLFSLLIITSYSAVFLEPLLIVPGHENLCYDKEDNAFYKKGEEMKWKYKICGRKICGGSHGKNSVYAEVQTCGKIDVPKECYTKVNLHLAYPNCCEWIVCPETRDLEKNIT